MLGDARPGDEPLVAVDHPGVAFLLRAGADHGGIGAAAGCGLGHGEGGAHFAVDDRPQPSLLLRRRSHQREQIHIAIVRRGAIERERPEDRAVRLLIHRRPADDRQRHAAERLGRLRRPQARRFRLRLHLCKHIEADVLVLVVVCHVGFERQHVLVDEAARAPPDIFDLGREREVHGAYPVTSRGRPQRNLWRTPIHVVSPPGPGCLRNGARRKSPGHESYPLSATIWPPSTTRVVPAMKRPASETSSSRAPSRSRSSPKRPTGISRLIAAPCSLSR